MFANIASYNNLLLSPEDSKLDLLLVTIATEPTDGYVRFMRTAERYGYNVKVSYLSLLAEKDTEFFLDCRYGCRMERGGHGTQPRWRTQNKYAKTSHR